MPPHGDGRGEPNQSHFGGYEPLDEFAIRWADWWTDYYLPFRTRMAELGSLAADDPTPGAVIEEARRKIAVFETFWDSYGYVFNLVRKPDEWAACPVREL